MIDFGGWDMPVSYPAGTIKEHKAVREAAGVFDVCHMGEAFLRGPRATEAVQRLTTNDVGGVAPGKAVYTLLCRPDGGIVDDCIFYKRAEDEYFVIINASNRDKIAAHVGALTKGVCSFEDVSDATALIAFQGPKALGDPRRSAAPTLASLHSFCVHATRPWQASHVTPARTGYTGEDGLEIFVRERRRRPRCGTRCSSAGEEGVAADRAGRARQRCGSSRACRCTATTSTTTNSPLEAGLGWIVKLDKARLHRQVSALVAQKAQGVVTPRARRLRRSKTAAIARHGYPLLDSSPREQIGTVTSGSPGISVTGKRSASAYVPLELRRDRDRARRRLPRPQGRGCHGGQDPVLQARPSAARPHCQANHITSEADVQRRRAIANTRRITSGRRPGVSCAVGITAFAVEQLGDITLVEPRRQGRRPPSRPASALRHHREREDGLRSVRAAVREGH
jgi:aminomethyltransferase